VFHPDSYYLQASGFQSAEAPSGARWNFIPSIVASLTQTKVLMSGTCRLARCMELLRRWQELDPNEEAVGQGRMIRGRNIIHGGGRQLLADEQIAQGGAA